MLDYAWLICATSQGFEILPSQAGQQLRDYACFWKVIQKACLVTQAAPELPKSLLLSQNCSTDQGFKTLTSQADQAARLRRVLEHPPKAC